MRLKLLVAAPTERATDPEAPYIAQEHIESSVGWLLTDPEPLSEGRSAVAHSRGDVLFGKLRPYLAKSLLATTAGAGSGELIVLRPNQRRVLPEWLLYLTLSHPFIEWAVANSYGVKMPRTSWERLGEFSLNPPPLRTQQAIASFLDEETARIDDLIAKKRRLIELLEERRVSLITSAVTKGLDPGVPMRDSGLPWIGDVPSHWSIAPLRRCADVRLSSIDKKTEEGETTVQLCNYTDVYYGSYLGPSEAFMTATASQSQIDRLALKEGDVLITKDSETPDDIGVPAVVGEPMPGVVCGYHLALLRPTGHLTGRYLYWALASHDINSHLRLTARGVTRFGLTLQAIGDTPIPVPPPDEQHHIERRLRETDTQVGGLRRRVEEQIDLLAEYRQALITAAVTGELDITTHDGDEALDEVTESA